jgi:ABC-2 type transport system permease protein
MAVYKRSYRPYEGTFTSEKLRFLVLPRYAFADLFGSRPLLTFFISCFFPTILAIAFLYIANSSTAQAMIGLKGEMLTVNGFVFAKYFIFQGWLGFLLVAWVGPGLISVDLSNDALPLYLSRPFSRVEYLVGKFCVIAILISAITWVPGLLLFGLQSSLAGWSWFSQNYWIAGSLVLGSLIWIVLLALLVLAISAWVKWRIAATALMLVIFFVSPGFGEAVNATLRTQWGSIFNPPYLISRIWFSLFRVELPAISGIPVWTAWLVLSLMAVISLIMLNARLKAREVVR